MSLVKNAELSRELGTRFFKPAELFSSCKLCGGTTDTDVAGTVYCHSCGRTFNLQGIRVNRRIMEAGEGLFINP